jgi:tRNA (cmo5U34)-methyltransferase
MDNPSAWKSNEAAEIFNKIADTVIPKRRELISTVAGLALKDSPEHPRILDLGCGSGELTAAILVIRPGASVTMLDFNDEMLRLCGDRFNGNNNIRTIQHDLNTGLPTSISSEPFDAVVSLCTIHVLKPDSRIKLYSDIRNALKENGRFVDGDRFSSGSNEYESPEFNGWIQYRVNRLKEEKSVDKSFDEIKREQMDFDKKMGHRPDTIAETERGLLAAGFHHINVTWKYLNFAVITGSK